MILHKQHEHLLGTVMVTATESTLPSNLTSSSPVSTSITEVPASQQLHSQERLSLPPLPRIALATFVSTFSGFFLGFAYGSKTAGLRFRAENAHRLPTTQPNWYLYHKSKNYHVIRAGVREGVRMGSKLGVWVLLFFVVENGIDQYRIGEGVPRLERDVQGRLLADTNGDLMLVEGSLSDESKKDCVSTTLAGLGVAAAYSAWNRLPLNTASSLIRIGLTFGAAYGLVQDGGALLKGNKVFWLEGAKNFVSEKDNER